MSGAEGEAGGVVDGEADAVSVSTMVSESTARDRGGCDGDMKRTVTGRPRAKALFGRVRDVLRVQVGSLALDEDRPARVGGFVDVLYFEGCRTVSQCPDP